MQPVEHLVFASRTGPLAREKKKKKTCAWPLRAYASSFFFPVLSSVCTLHACERNGKFWGGRPPGEKNRRLAMKTTQLRASGNPWMCAQVRLTFCYMCMYITWR